MGPHLSEEEPAGVRTLPSGQLPDPVCRDSLSCLDSPTQPCLPVPPTVRLMSWLRGGLMGRQSCHQCCLGTVAGLPEKPQRQRQVSTWGQEALGEAREGVEPLRQPQGSAGPSPLAWAPSNHSHRGPCCLPLSLPGVLHTWGQGSSLTPLVGTGNGAGALVQPLGTQASPSQTAGRVGGAWRGEGSD